MMRFVPTVFRKYDVRGLFPGQLNRELALSLGRVLSRSADGPVAIGRDCRHSGDQLFSWLCQGCRMEGAEVIDLGVQTTPMTYYAAHLLSPSVTVMITGSHNPPEYNGFKIMRGQSTVFGSEIQDLKKRMESLDTVIVDTPDRTLPPVRKVSVRSDYIRRLLSEFSFRRTLKVVIDGGNGTGGTIAREVLEALGCRVIPLYCRMDGSFPNHHPDPTVEANLKDLRAAVLAEKADLGVSYDGDADRLGIIDNDGSIIWGDRILILFARALLETNPGATVISEVKASKLFFEAVEAAGGRAVMSPTGHSLIKNAMKREGALLAGEMSGHIFFRDRYYGFDDALYATLRFIEIVSRSGSTPGEMLSDLPRVFNTPEIREECPDALKFGVVEEVVRQLRLDGRDVDTTDGARITFDDGWGLVRASNTQPVLVLRFEAGTSDSLREYESYVRKLIDTAGRTVNDT